MSERDLAKPATQDRRTPGELLFEQYFSSRQIPFEFEKRYPGKRKKPDYSIGFGQGVCVLEVKDFVPGELPGPGGAYDAMDRIRRKIDEGTEKFQEYKEFPCGLVLHNQGAPLVHLETAEIMFGSMFGNPGFSTPIDIRTGIPAGPTRRAFLGGGKMINARKRTPRIAQISALITVRVVNVGYMRLQQYVESLPESHAKDTWGKAAALWKHLRSVQLPFDQTETAIGVMVWENIFGERKLPKLFNGLYDEQWTIDKNSCLSLAYRGVELQKLQVPDRAPVDRFFRSSNDPEEATAP